MKIKNIVCSSGRTGFFFDDQRAIKNNATRDGGTYKGTPVTKGFKSPRQAGESISIMLVLEDGQIAYGDCAAVQYSGAGGRDPLFLAEAFIPQIIQNVSPLLIGRELTSFRGLAEEIDSLMDSETGLKLHTAIRYGLTQSVLDAVSKAKRVLMTDIIANEYATEVSQTPIPIFTQCGDSRYENTDKMIIKRADVLPHGLINNVKEKLGDHGELLLDYVIWLRDRVSEIRPDSSYQPILHLDVYGTLGTIFNDDFDIIAGYMQKLEKAAYPLLLRIEGPVDMEEREAQMISLRELTRRMDDVNSQVQIVADEWCNTLEDIKYFADNKAGHMIQIKTPDLGGINNVAEAVLYCKQAGVSAYQGGTCNETDLSSKACVHIAMATKPDQILAKPGMGADEGFMIVYNEMHRILALKKALRQVTV